MCVFVCVCVEISDGNKQHILEQKLFRTFHYCKHTDEKF